MKDGVFLWDPFLLDGTALRSPSTTPGVVHCMEQTLRKCHPVKELSCFQGLSFHICKVRHTDGQVNTLQTMWLETLRKRFPPAALPLQVSNQPMSKLQMGQ